MRNETSSNLTVMQLVTGLGVGGAERVVMELAGRLAERGIHSVVVALDDKRRLMEQYPHVQTQAYSLGMTRNPWSFGKTVMALLKIMRREKVKIVHAHMFHSLCMALICKLLYPEFKIVFTSHSSKGFSFWRRLLIRMSKPLRDADVVFVLGQHPNLNTARTVVIPNGVPVNYNLRVAATNLPDKRRVFLFVGRLEPLKNPVNLLKSFAAMKHNDCELWLAGEGVMRPDVERQIVKSGLTGRVRLLGVCQDVPQLLAQADCFVMASLWEGLPMALLEAGVVGLPVVAPPVGAIPEVLDDDCGYLADVSELHHVLDEVLDNYAEASRRGRRLREKVINNYSLDHMWQAHATLYESLMQNK